MRDQRRPWFSTLGLLAALAAIALLAGCRQPPWELRAYHTGSAGVFTDSGGTSTWQYGMSRVAGRYVCPYCGYSTAIVANPGGTNWCPNPWGVGSHPGNVNLQFQPIDRCFLSTTGTAVTHPSGLVAPAIVGRPFHPHTGDDVTGSTVRLAASGIQHFNNPNINNDDATGDFCRFLVVEPGARYPSASLRRNAAGAPIMGDTADDAAHLDWDDIGIRGSGDPSLHVHLNPYRVTDGEVFHVQLYTVGFYDGLTGALVKIHVAVRVWSNLEGLVSFMYLPIAGTTIKDFTLEAGNGSVRIDFTGLTNTHVPATAPPANGPLGGTIVMPFVMSAFQVVSNSRLIPGLGEDTTADPTWLDPPPADWPWSEDPANPPSAGWSTKASYFRIPTTGLVADWLSQVVGSSAAGKLLLHPYVIPPSAVGKGWVIAEWQKADAGTTISASPITKHTLLVGANNWYWDEGAEWNYDWLVETHATANDPATPTHLWGNSNAAANVRAGNPIDTQADLTNFHTETAAADHYQSTNPVPYFITSFMSSRLQVPPTAQSWDKDGTGGTLVPLESDTDLGRGTATLLMGDGPASGGNITGSYEPGTPTATRQAVVLNRMIAALKCPACGSVDTDLSATICKFCGTAISAPANLLPGDAVTGISVQDAPSMTTQSPRRPQTALPNSRPAITEGALASSAGSGILAPWQVPAPPVPTPLPAPTPYLFSLGFDLPAYLPPSAPMVGTNPAASDLIADNGYFGRLVLVHRPQFYPGQVAGSTEASPDPNGRGVATLDSAGHWTYNHRWDVGYRCPTCGAWENIPGPCTNTVADTGYGICPVCAIPVPPGQLCPYCGHAATAWSAAATFCNLGRVTPYDLGSEEYEPFNVVISVLRKLDLSRTMATLDLGRVAPGVPRTAPDSTVGGSSVDPNPAPSDVAPSRRFDVLNEGNVWAPLAAGSVQDTDLVRAGIDTDFGAMSYHERVASVPLPWNLLFPTGFGSGLPAGEAAGAAGGASTGYLQAGTRIGVVEPIPLGQPAGVHTGRVIVYTDLNGDGALNFFHPGTGVTSSATNVFDPSVDLPLEPVADLDVRLRVAEGRIPQDDYFSADVAPAIAFDLGATGSPTTLHLVWMGNRAPVGNVGDVAPPGLNPAALPTTTSPFNLLYANANASLLPDVLGNQTYRHFEWAGAGGLPANASALTVDSAPGAINESPFVLPTSGIGGVSNNLALWHRLFPSANGWESTLRYNQSTAPNYTGNGGFVFASSRDMQGLKAIYFNNLPWLFWHAGAEGQQQIYSLPNFDPAMPTAGAQVPISLAFGSTPHHERTTVHLSDLSDLAVHRFAASAFTYTRDPSVLLTSENAAGGYVAPGAGETVLNVLFTGYVRGDENTDICWSKFLIAPGGGVGERKAFPRLDNRVNLPGTGSPALSVGEELKPDSRRQYFSSQHLEWVCHDVSDVDNFGVTPNVTLQDAEIFLGLASSGAVPTRVYTVHFSGGTWSRERNAYYVQPRFTMIYPTSGADPLHDARCLAGDGATGYRVIDPSTAAQATPQPLTMEINPASGTVRFSSPLFDAETPTDPMAVLNAGNLVTATDVQVYANYTPTVWRLTRDPAADDCPYAFWSPNDTGALNFFWRRSYSAADTPFEGRSVFMYKQWAPSVQVRRPPMTGATAVSVSYDNGGTWTAVPSADYDLFADTGYIVFHNLSVNDQSGANQVPFLVRVSYTGAGGGAVVDEQHLALSWTQERRVPIDAEVAAGPLSVAHESYPATVLGGTVTVGRFWLAWSSPRSLLDLRPTGSSGGALRQSADVYLASVVPTLGTAVADPHTCSLPVP